MSTNDFKKFCETNSGTNLLTQAEYIADAQRLIGNQPGIARDKLVNKVLRQSAFISSAFVDYVVQQTGFDVLDDNDTSGLLAKITSCFATGLPIGSISKMVTSAVPTGFLKVNGAAISRTTYAALFNVLVTVPGFTSQSFSVTIATPAIFTKASHGFTGGERLRLSTTGTLPTGLDTTTDYFVFLIDANTFYLQTMSNVLAGTVVNTSGSQGGVHSFQRSLWGLGDGATTFNVPDLRGAFGRYWDDARGLDPSRAIASFQRDTTKKNGLSIVDPGHTHTNQAGFTAGTGTGASVAYKLITPAYAYVAIEASGAVAAMGITSSVTSVTIGAGDYETRPVSYALMPVIKY